MDKEEILEMFEGSTAGEWSFCTSLELFADSRVWDDKGQCISGEPVDIISTLRHETEFRGNKHDAKLIESAPRLAEQCLELHRQLEVAERESEERSKEDWSRLGKSIYQEAMDRHTAICYEKKELTRQLGVMKGALEAITSIGGGFDDLNGHHVVSHCNKALAAVRGD